MGFGVAKDIVHNPAAFDTRNDMFHEDTDTRNLRILGFLFCTEFLLSGFFLRLIGTDTLRFKALEARILKEHTARWKRLAFFITNPFVMDASSTCSTEVTDQTLFYINDQVVFYPMVFFFPLYFGFRVKAPVTRRPPHRSVREQFAHTVPR